VPARFALELSETGESWRAYEPTSAEVVVAAPRLAAYYNEPHNRAMLAHASELSVDDVIEHYRGLVARGGRPFLLEHAGALVGDADVRHIEDGRGEAAILVGERSVQGRGLGTRFGVMLHAFAFRQLALARLYVSVLPANHPSLRLFEKLGYERDDTPAARRYADEPDDLTLSLTAARFAALHGARAALVSVTRRAPPSG
jgi:RimJ/RimL family protein N-acetyltransferase